MLARKCKWREKRRRGWSSMLYYGFELKIEKQHILVTELSHGLRALLIEDLSDYRFDFEDSVEVPQAFYDLVMRALAADIEFQRHLEEYKKIMHP